MRVELPLADIEQEFERLLNASREAGLVMRLLGGLAVKRRCPSAEKPPFKRNYPDLDFAADRQTGKQLPQWFATMGYTANRNFNTLNGDRRQLYYDEPNQRQVDVFVGEFEMCHRVSFADRLIEHSETVTLADLFLTKAQIIQLNRKDALDLDLLLLDHPIGNSNGDEINGSLIADICARDWGIFTTLSLNLERLLTLNQNDLALAETDRQVIFERISQLNQLMEKAPKNNSWKLRAKVGKRVKWYTEVEEVQR